MKVFYHLILYRLQSTRFREVENQSYLRLQFQSTLDCTRFSDQFSCLNLRLSNTFVHRWNWSQTVIWFFLLHHSKRTQEDAIKINESLFTQSLKLFCDIELFLMLYYCLSHKVVLILPLVSVSLNPNPNWNQKKKREKTKENKKRANASVKLAPAAISLPIREKLKT